VAVQPDGDLHGKDEDVEARTSFIAPTLAAPEVLAKMPGLVLLVGVHHPSVRLVPIESSVPKVLSKMPGLVLLVGVHQPSVRLVLVESFVLSSRLDGEGNMKEKCT
jgi:hypothetical protein